MSSSSRLNELGGDKFKVTCTCLTCGNTSAEFETTCYLCDLCGMHENIEFCCNNCGAQLELMGS